MSEAQPWDADFLQRAPAFDILRAACAHLDLLDWPTAAALSRAAAALQPSPCNQAGLPVCFVEPAAVEGVSYESSIHSSGRVACRPCDWHDFMNALVWMTFPLAKAALNGRHVAAMAEDLPGQRGRVRDTLTLFDEGGAIVLSSDQAVLEDIRCFRWKEVFWRQRARFLATTRVLVFGHAMHQKLLDPFVGVCAQALLAHAPAALLSADTAAQVRFADAYATAAITDGQRLRTPHDLAPLPILGVPGWFARAGQEAFYDEVTYFRPGRGRDARGRRTAGALPPV